MGNKVKEVKDMVEAVSEIPKFSNAESQDHSAKARMIRSKYGMLEILRATFNKRDATLLLRELNHKFRALADDPYLDLFEKGSEPMV